MYLGNSKTASSRASETARLIRIILQTQSGNAPNAGASHEGGPPPAACGQVLFDVVSALDQDAPPGAPEGEVCYIVTDDGRTVRWCSVL